MHPASQVLCTLDRWVSVAGPGSPLRRVMWVAGGGSAPRPGLPVCYVRYSVSISGFVDDLRDYSAPDLPGSVDFPRSFSTLPSSRQARSNPHKAPKASPHAAPLDGREVLLSPVGRR